MGTGPGTFANVTNLTTVQTFFHFYGLFFSDADGDGVEEVFTVSFNHILQYGVFADDSLAFEGTINEGFNGSINNIATIDLNGDGLRDVLRLSGEEGILYAYLNNGPQGFAQPVILISFSSSIHQFVLFDMDGDGDQDIIIMNPPAMRIYENQGNMVFTQVSSA